MLWEAWDRVSWDSTGSIREGCWDADQEGVEDRAGRCVCAASYIWLKKISRLVKNCYGGTQQGQLSLYGWVNERKPKGTGPCWGLNTELELAGHWEPFLHSISPLPTGGKTMHRRGSKWYFLSIYHCHPVDTMAENLQPIDKGSAAHAPSPCPLCVAGCGHHQ